MKLYTDNKGNWTGTQNDAIKNWGKDRALIHVPTSKEALLRWLNDHRVLSQASLEVKAAAEGRQYTTTIQHSGKMLMIKDLDKYNIKDIAHRADLHTLSLAMSVYMRRMEKFLVKNEDDRQPDEAQEWNSFDPDC